MEPWLSTLIVVVGVGFGLWLLSFMVEALRAAPQMPTALSWAPAIPINYLEIGGTNSAT
jgi:hypothetical protein